MIGGTGNLRAPGFYFPVEVRTDISASLAAGLAGEPGLDVREPDVIGPTVPADRNPVAAMVVRAIDQETANARGTHFSEGDLLAGESGHVAIKAQAEATSKSSTQLPRLPPRVRQFWRLPRTLMPQAC
jgi:hypothetical protein